MTDNYFGIAAAALRRGYHVLLHDGPGQGRLLFEEGLPLRHDWERVVTPVVDAALAIDVVDPKRLVYQAWSLGGYMAPRVAAFEPRLAAVVADPGQIDVGVKFVPAMRMMGLSDAAIARLPELAPDDEATVMAVVTGNKMLHWQIVKRGFWANGASDLASFIGEMWKWKLDDEIVARIKSPMLVTSAEGDRASTNARELYDALTCPKACYRFTAADARAAAEHVGHAVHAHQAAVAGRAQTEGAARAVQLGAPGEQQAIRGDERMRQRFAAFGFEQVSVVEELHAGVQRHATKPHGSGYTVRRCRLSAWSAVASIPLTSRT
jgi:hypothetical protein